MSTAYELPKFQMLQTNDLYYLLDIYIIMSSTFSKMADFDGNIKQLTLRLTLLFISEIYSLR